MQDVTSEQVRQAALAVNITYIPHHDCGGCGSMVAFVVENGRLFFDSICDCGHVSNGPEPRDWSAAADWINMQDDEHKIEIANRFGLKLAADAKAKEPV